jgi:hypothetical protein
MPVFQIIYFIKWNFCGQKCFAEIAEVENLEGPEDELV